MFLEDDRLFHLLVGPLPTASNRGSLHPKTPYFIAVRVWLFYLHL